jgi:hypothetical protein
MILLLTLAEIVVIGAASDIVLLQQQQASALQDTCDSIVDPTCTHHRTHHSAEDNKTPFILPFP